MLDLKPCVIPISAMSTPYDLRNGKKFNGLYREHVRCLLYLAKTDILYVVNCFSQMQKDHF